MSGGFQHNPAGVPASQTQSDVMSSRSKSLTVNANQMPPATVFAKMPVTASSLLRIPSLQEFPNLPSLPFPVAFPNASHGAYLFADNGYMASQGTYIKEEKIDQYIKEEKMNMYIKEEKIEPVPASAAPLSIGNQQQPQRPPSHNSTPSPRSASYSPSGDSKKNKKREESVLQRSVPPYQQNSSSNRAGAGRNPSPGIPTVVLTNHHHQILRYPPNSDALLSSSAISYGDSEMLPEGGFDVHVGNSLGSLDDGLLSTNLAVSGSGGGTATFDLFDEEAGHESYMGDGSQALQLSPHAFPNNGETFSLNDSSNLSGVPEQGSEGTIGSSENATTACPGTGNKLTVAAIAEKGKSKSRPLKASSPNRTTTQTCQVCGKVFSNSSALAKHKLTHSDERKYVCQLCTKAFKRQDHLNGHLLTHMNKKPYECKVEGCGKSYCDARSLRRHTENHHSSASQAAMAAAAAATVNAIAVRVGAPLALSRNLAFGSDAKIETNGTSFLANALQSDRIRYAPPPTTSVVTRPSAPPPPYNTAVSTTATTEAMDKIASSAASHLQLLAFQQHEQHQTGEQTSLLQWEQQQQQQQQQPNSNILYISSPLGQQNFCDEQQQASSRSQHSTDRPSSKNSEISDPYLGQGAAGSSSTSHIQNVAATSVLAQCLKLGLPSQVHLSQNSVSSITGQQIQLGDLMPQGSVLHAVGSTSSSQQLAADLSQTLQLRNQWMQSSGYPLPGSTNATAGVTTAAATFVVEPKPVECNICQRKFKNIPALNGHMRLHGGYLKKEMDGNKKLDKRSDSKPHQPPLQTASMNIRALIEEKIIQRRIVNPPLNTPIPPPPPSLHPSVTLSLPSPSSHTLMTSSTPTSYASPPAAGSLVLQNTSCSSEGGELMDFSDPCIPESDSPHPLTQHDHHCSHPEQHYEPQLHHPSPPETGSVPHPLEHFQETQHQFQQHHSIDSSSYSNDIKMKEDAQSDMQRQIEIIKQGLMSHQPISEKFRRHSDSDHFLAPRSYLGSINSPSFIDFLRRKVVGKRTQRTGSDPGEFAVSSFEGMFPSSLVEEMDDECQSGGENDAPGNSEIPEEELPDQTDSLAPSEMMDFEIGVGMPEALPPQLSLPTLIRNDSPLLEATLSSTTHTTLTNFNTIPSSTEINYEDIGADNAVTTSCSTIPKVKVEEDDDVFLSPSSIPTSPIRTKKKHRPEPLYIPPQVNTGGFQSRLRSPRLWDPISAGRISSPPPYTPPPMLSPVRSGSGLFWHVISGSGSLTPKSAPLTPGRLGLIPDIIPPATVPEEEEEVSEPPETDIQPHVNIGPHFQAKLPNLRSNLNGYDPKFADLVWDPKTEECLNDKEVEMYLQFACCAAIPGGGRNKEYALHVLQMADGNIKDAMLKLMDPNPKLQSTHPLLTYPYAESDKWTTDEIESYQQALMTNDKDFFCIAQEVKSKTVKQCIQFYYLWKKICPDEYKRLRVARRKRELDGAQYNLRSKLEDSANDGDSPKSGDPATSPGRTTDASGDRFVCDHPDCFASFSSRQALNGHIRIHGGYSAGKSFTNTNGTHNQSPSNNGDSGGQVYSPSTNPASNASTQYGEVVEEFPCKICGKVFFKVKSRSAHMKSHRPMDPDRQK